MYRHLTESTPRNKTRSLDRSANYRLHGGFINRNKSSFVHRHQLAAARAAKSPAGFLPTGVRYKCICTCVSAQACCRCRLLVGVGPAV